VNISIDFSKTTGKIKPMHAIGQPPFSVGENGIGDEFMSYLRDANIPYSRLHDTYDFFGGNMFVDIPNLFRDFDADENDPDSYDFIFTDKLLEMLVKNGVEPYFRLGVTIENAHTIKAYRIFPPKNFEKWARICEHVIRHYNEGWANGYHMGITYWEIWNEPDNEEDISLNNMWKGTAEQYFDLYVITAKHLRSCFGNTIKIGGYACTGLYLGFIRNENGYAEPHERTHWEKRAVYHTAFLKRFLDRVKKDQAPLDFFSHHSYMYVPKTLEVQRYAEELFADAGFTDVEFHLNEWNPDRTMETRGTSQASADAAAMMIAMHETQMSMMCYYDARVGTSVYGGLFNPLTLQPFCTYYSFKAFGYLYGLGNRVSVTGQEGSLYALAAENNGKKAVLFANIGDNTPIQTNLTGSFKAYLIDFDHHMTPVDIDPSGFELGRFQTLLLKTE